MTFDPDFATATQALAALRRRAISSRELTAHVFDRIRKVDPALNCFVTLAEGAAMARARQADAALARKKPLGPLHGLPIVVKDTWATAGLRTTSGSKSLEQHVPQEDAVVVERLKAAGAVVMGKTNAPEWAADWQSYNEVAGTSRNPWDPARTPGGSTGGGAAAVAAGLGFLEIGSDIAGSIRIPASFCGVYGHKPSGAWCRCVGISHRRRASRDRSRIYPWRGPIARGAADLALELGVVGGPDRDEAVAYRWTLPKARRARLRDYRVGYVLDDPMCPVDAPVKAVARGRGRRAPQGRHASDRGLARGHRRRAPVPALPLAPGRVLLPDAAPGELEATHEARRKGADDPWTMGVTAQHREWLPKSAARLAARAAWQQYFKTHDAFLMPVAFVPAFPHDHSMPLGERKLMTTAGERFYVSLYRWISFATLTGCPATSAPVGRTREGLPVGLQIMGPYLEDATPIDIAARMADVTGGFVAPPNL